jgi:hypothetical protein
LSKALDWFEAEEHFNTLCRDALSQARTERAEEFASQMSERAKRYGLNAFLSEEQLTWLCKIADWDKPPRRSPAPLKYR